MNSKEQPKARRTGLQGVFVALLCLSVSLALLPQAQAIVPNINYDLPGPGSNQDTYAQQVSAISGVISAGGVGVSFNHPDVVASSSSVFSIGAFLTGPDLASGLVPDTFTWSLSVSGCTAGTATQIDLASVTSDTSSWTNTITMTSSQCRGVLTVTQAVGAGAVTIAHLGMPFNVRADQAYPTGFSNAISGSLNVHQDPICPSSAHCFVDSASSTVNVNTAPGFFELYGPILVCLLALAYLTRAPIWLVPEAICLGFVVMVLAFQQTGQALILLQASAGAALVAFGLFALTLRWLEFKKPKRRLFDNDK